MIYICIPSHNEDRTVGVLLWKIRQVMADFPRDYQILVLDDASTDATRQVLEPYTRVLPLTVARNAERQGYAASVEMLLREAVHRAPYPKRDVAVVLQADFTHDPDDLPALVRRIESGADVVVGAQTVDEQAMPRAVRWARRAARVLLRCAEWPEGVTDPLSGYRAYRVMVLKRAIEACDDGPLLRTDGWTADVELLRAVLPHARRVAETPVTVRPDRLQRETRLAPWRMLRALAAFLWAHRGDRTAPPAGPDEAEEARPRSHAGDVLEQSVFPTETQQEPERRPQRRRRRSGSRGGRRRRSPQGQAGTEPSGRGVAAEPTE